MAGDLRLHRPAAGDLTLDRDRPATGDLWLQQRSPGDLRLTQPPERQASLHARLDVTLPPLAVDIQAEYGAHAALSADLPAVSIDVRAAYDNAVWRGISHAARTHWQPAVATPVHACGTYGATREVRTTTCASAGAAQSTPVLHVAPWRQLDRRFAMSRVPAASGRLTPVGTGAHWTQLRPRHLTRCIIHQQAAPARPGLASSWIQLSRVARPILVVHWQTAGHRGAGLRSSYQQGQAVRHRYCWLWRSARLRQGWGGPIIIPIPEPPSPEDDCTPIGQADLALQATREGGLILLRCPSAPPGSGTIVIPALRAYVVINDARLVRVSDNMELPALAMSMSIDSDSWGWRCGATLPADQLPYLQSGDEPIEIEITVNTYNWRFLVENIRRQRRFGQAEIHITGRSLAARLGAPYVGPVDRGNSTDLNATQILDDLLTENGVPLGWTIDWQLTDWLVTAGAWSHRGTYLEGVRKVAEAAGAIIQADRTARTLHLLHRYPVPPWDWATSTPVYSVPEAVITTEGVEWRENAPYNAAYVSGESQGIIGHCVRAGTAGDRPAPMVVHPLITAAEAARQKGLAMLADTGRQEIITLSMPLSPADYGIGLMTPAMLIEYGDAAKRGLVRSTRIDVQRAEVRQTISLETRP